ncbi:MAG: tol-pal system protein YbgF [Gammaproteobacteria bacterium]
MRTTAFRRIRFGRTVVGLIVVGLVLGCTLLEPPEKNPLYIRQTELDTRLTRVERVVDSEGLVNLLKQVEQLQQEIQTLRGQVEQLEFGLEQAGNAQKQQYLDVDQRLQALEKSAGQRQADISDARSVLDGGELQPGQLPVPGGTDRANYQASFELLKQGRYKEASAALKQFMVAFPDSSLSDNAQYWLAETHYVSQNYAKALREFTVVVDKYPQSRKIPDALLKIGYCDYELKHFSEARTALKRVVAEFPETTAARLASQRLERMTSEGV